MSEFLFVSVVVPTWNRAPLLADCLGSLKAQDYPHDRFEIIVVDDGSTDETARVVHQFQNGLVPEVHYIQQQHGGLNVARNAGIAAAKGDPICFVDDDVDTPPGWLRAVVEGALRHPEAGCLGGPIRMRFEAPPPRICEMESWISEAELDYGPAERAVPQVFGANMSVRRWALAQVGLFNELLPLYGEETEWQRRLSHAGIAILYIPSAWLWHRRTASDVRVMKLLNRRFRQGKAHVAYARLVGEEIALWHTLWPVPFYLLHAFRRRCFGALFTVAWKLGVVWQAVKVRRGSA